MAYFSGTSSYAELNVRTAIIELVARQVIAGCLRLLQCSADSLEGSSPLFMEVSGGLAEVLRC